MRVGPSQNQPFADLELFHAEHGSSQTAEQRDVFRMRVHRGEYTSGA